MAVTYEMVIKDLETINKFGIENIVRRVHWNMEATDSDTGLKGVVRNVDVFQIEEHAYDSPAINHYVTVPAEFNPNEYTPYSELTKDHIEEWIAGKLGQDAMDGYRATALKNLQEKIANQNNNTQSTPLPWA
jgi:hypothetical protein